MKTRRRLLIGGIVLGVVLALVSIIEGIGAVVALVHQFAALSKAGVNDPQVVQEKVQGSMYYVSFAVMGVMAGGAVFGVSLAYFLRLREAVPPPLPLVPLG